MPDPEVFDVANILIVDDDPAVQITIRLLLERAGHHVTVAGDGRRGLALFEASQFDLLFLDIFMPGMDGLETMRHIRALQQAIPIIVVSGRSITPDAYAEPDFLKMATKLGAVASLQKPFRPDALLAAVDSCLTSAQPSQQPNAGSGCR
nr:response regulator [Bradyrhizobium sp. 1]